MHFTEIDTPHLCKMQIKYKEKVYFFPDKK